MTKRCLGRVDIIWVFCWWHSPEVMALVGCEGQWGGLETVGRAGGHGSGCCEDATEMDMGGYGGNRNGEVVVAW